MTIQNDNIDIWHPDPDTGNLTHIQQITTDGVRQYFTDGDFVGEFEIDKQGNILTDAQRLKNLHGFYGSGSLEELVLAQSEHIERLQAILDKNLQE